MKQKLSFILVACCCVMFFILAWFKNTDVTTVIPLLVGAYIGGRTISKSAFGVAAGRDPNCDTKETVSKLDETD